MRLSIDSHMNKTAPISLTDRDDRYLGVINRGLAEAKRILRKLRSEREREEKSREPVRDILAEVKQFVRRR